MKWSDVAEYAALIVLTGVSIIIMVGLMDWISASVAVFP